jgi:hypothetical protein
MVVVVRGSSSGWKRPLLSIRCDAKMVLMSVDFPRPVWPAIEVSRGGARVLPVKLTNANDIELEAPLNGLLLDLLGDAVESDIAVREDGLGLVGGSHCG